MRMRTLTVLFALAVPAATPALAQGYNVFHPYGPGYRVAPYGHAGYGGFAKPFVRGEYIGAPFTVVPRPDQIVPSPWSYGTYGVPTVSGIARPPVGQPTLTVIHAPSGRRSARTAAPASAEDAADVRVVSVSVPRR